MTFLRFFDPRTAVPVPVQPNRAGERCLAAVFSALADWSRRRESSPRVAPRAGVQIRIDGSCGRECTFPRFEPSGFLASEIAVACLVTFEVVIKKNGRKAIENAIHHFTLDHGRVTKWRGWQDTAFTKATWLG